MKLERPTIEWDCNCNNRLVFDAINLSSIKSTFIQHHHHHWQDGLDEQLRSYEWMIKSAVNSLIDLRSFARACVRSNTFFLHGNSLNQHSLCIQMYANCACAFSANLANFVWKKKGMNNLLRQIVQISGFFFFSPCEPTEREGLIQIVRVRVRVRVCDQIHFLPVGLTLLPSQKMACC